MNHLNNCKLDIDVVEFYYLKGFCTDKKVLDKMVEIIDKNAAPSTVTEQGERRTTDYRTSNSCYLDQHVCPQVIHLQKLITHAVKIPESHSEPMQGSKYEVGQYFKEHTDFFDPDSANYEAFAPNGNQRSWTFMLYLNDVEEGGYTRFSQLKLQFKPKAGDALLWNNLMPNMRENLYTSHEALPPESNNKYIITQWYRKDLYRTQDLLIQHLD